MPRPVHALIIAVLFGMSTEGYDRLWEAHLLQAIHFPLIGQLQPVVWFGLIRMGTALLSTVSQADAIGQTAFGPVIGWIGTVRGLRTALMVAAAALVPAVPLFARAGRQGASRAQVAANREGQGTTIQVETFSNRFVSFTIDEPSGTAYDSCTTE